MKGLKASEALLCPAFEPMSQKVTVLSELNGFIKKLKNKKMKEFQEKAAKNSPLIIGGQGAWNKLFEPVVLEEFGLGINNHDITSFVSLLRIIRNILQHPESKNSMLAICGNSEPSTEEVLTPLLQRFPWFYPHALYCLHTHFEHQPSKPIPELMLSCYQPFEDLVCQRQNPQPLQENGIIILQYESLHGCARERLVALRVPKSCVVLSDLEPQVAELTNQLRSKLDADDEIPITEHIFKCKAKTMKQPFAPTFGCKKSMEEGQEKVMVPEGSLIQILKPEVRVEFPQKGQQVSMPFKEYQTVKVIKGFALKNACKGCAFKNLVVSFDGTTLRDDQRIADLEFTKNSFVVNSR